MKRMLSVALIALMAPAAMGQTKPRPTATRPSTQPAFRTIDTPYYTLHTDVSDQEAKEADLRLTRIFEEYQRRTAGFAGQAKEKLPFYLFRKEADYQAAGGPPKSAGVYIESRINGKRLMAIAGDQTDDSTWAVIQHEGFHQFVAATIKYDLPIWVNEGLAEYFSEGQWTGDGFVTGLISTSRLNAVRKGIRNGFQPFGKFMAMSDDQWSDNLKLTNYDQAWSMIHFLANADNGKYQGPFLQYMTAISKGVPGEQAWVNTFGKDTDAFQNKYAQWWLSLPDHPTQLGYMKVLVQTETSFLARAYILRQSFPDAKTFLTRYQPPDFGLNRDLWLPPKLFAEFNDFAPDVGKWSFQGQHLVLQLDDGTALVGSFSTANNKVTKVTVDLLPAGRGR